MATPILNQLEKYNNENTIRLHMPGHKGKLHKNDVTEIPGTDNLYFPDSCIKESLSYARNYFGAKETLYCVNGSTGGLMALILGNIKEKDVVLVDRCCHKSVINSLILAKAKIEFVLNRQDHDIAMPPSAGEVIANAADVKAKFIIITSPNYYGFCADIKTISKWSRENGVLLFVDEAHGFHFGASSLLPNSAISLGADASVSSCHKTAGGLTQAAVCNIANKSIISSTKRCFEMLQTSSPSYLIMSSIEKSIDFLQNSGELAYKALYKKICEIKALIEEKTKLSVLKTDDFSRLVICTKREKIYGYDLDKILRKSFNIQVEMSDMYHVVGIMTPYDDFDTASFVNCVVEALKLCEKSDEYKSIHIEYTEGAQVIPMYRAIGCNTKWVELSEAEGAISGTMVVPYPPGIPILFPGEKINMITIQKIYDIISLGGIVNGIKDGSIEIIKED